jgi:hypothetical protein
MPAPWLIMPCVLQMLCMVADEGYFHYRRPLPRWERLGHPLDTLTVLLCWSVIVFVEPRPISVAVYAVLSVLSCLCVTKDEWVHTQCCSAGEHWLHALLFILHPLTLASGGLLWPAMHARAASPLALGWLQYTGWERPLSIANAALTLLFGLYQLLYWNVLWKSDARAQSITISMTS